MTSLPVGNYVLRIVSVSFRARLGWPLLKHVRREMEGGRVIAQDEACERFLEGEEKEGFINMVRGRPEDKEEELNSSITHYSLKGWSAANLGLNNILTK